jgi:hypothetical protein
MRWYQDGSQGYSIWGCKLDGIGSWQGRIVGFGVSAVEGAGSATTVLKCTSPTNNMQHGIGIYLGSAATTLKWIRPMTSTKHSTVAPSESISCSFECEVSFWVHNILHKKTAFSQLNSLSMKVARCNS